MGGKRISPEQQEQVRIMHALGKSDGDVAVAVGISKAAVFNIRRKQAAEGDSQENIATRNRVQALKDEFVEGAWEAVRKGTTLVNDKLTQIIESGSVSEHDLREITTACGTLIDKARLTAGEATQIVDNVVKFEDL